MRKKKKGLLSSGFMFGVDQALQKYVKEHGRLPWRRSQDSKVGSINLGLEVKRCDECDRGDCSQCVRVNCEKCAYKQEFEKLMALPSCNDCRERARNGCQCAPRVGEFVRINCPMWSPEEGKEGLKE